jgi:hypothetical protein
MPIFVRRILLFALVLGLIGMQAELLLLGHFEDVWQNTPLVLMGIALLVLIGHAIRPGPGTVRGVRLLMVLFIAAGVLGTWLHYQSNSEFELEITPDMLYWPLFKAAITGAIPVLAPGSMIQLGLIGLAWAYRHPALGTMHDVSTTSPEARS